ncbi:hypothetical protein [Streptomyces spectabilis]|uniref:Uncharacterized protein n=1 Tax=Streptomyces spectabilis TaxID=68270 RepID=A0A516R269_STRST|nr:hypothetical protein [Streptomyces spectabilis]QDQ09744.1 hypothetical protein FH965_03535 [Streptomyces spectabilis]
MRYRAERIALAVMAGAGIVVVLADLLGWLDELAPGSTLPKVTLLILSTVTLFLLLEFDRLKVLDDVHAQLSKLDIDALARELRQRHYAGVVRVHERFPDDRFATLVDGAAREVTILQTWIPNLDEFDRGLRKAVLERQVRVRVLLLHPSSPVAGLRSEALRTVRDPARDGDVRASIEQCLSTLASLVDDAGDEDRARLEVRVYNSLPSVAVYKVDEHYLVSSFLHGRLAIRSTQMEIEGCATVMGREVQREVDTLWSIGCAVDLSNWRGSIGRINL